MTPEERDHLLVRYLDGNLTPTGTDALNGLLKTDAAARASLREMAMQAVLMGDLARERELAAPRKRSGHPRVLARTWNRRTLAFAAAVVLLAGAAAVWLGRGKARFLFGTGIGRPPFGNNNRLWKKPFQLLPLGRINGSIARDDPVDWLASEWLGLVKCGIGCVDLNRGISRE